MAAQSAAADSRTLLAPGSPRQSTSSQSTHSIARHYHALHRAKWLLRSQLTARMHAELPDDGGIQNGGAANGSGGGGLMGMPSRMSVAGGAQGQGVYQQHGHGHAYGHGVGSPHHTSPHPSPRGRDPFAQAPAQAHSGAHSAGNSAAYSNHSGGAYNSGASGGSPQPSRTIPTMARTAARHPTTRPTSPKPPAASCAALWTTSGRPPRRRRLGLAAPSSPPPARAPTRRTRPTCRACST